MTPLVVYARGAGGVGASASLVIPNASGGTRVRIVDLKGNPVRDLGTARSRTLLWDGRTGGGRKTSRGTSVVDAVAASTSARGLLRLGR